MRYVAVCGTNDYVYACMCVQQENGRRATERGRTVSALWPLRMRVLLGCYGSNGIHRWLVHSVIVYYGIFCCYWNENGTDIDVKLAENADVDVATIHKQFSTMINDSMISCRIMKHFLITKILFGRKKAFYL